MMKLLIPLVLALFGIGGGVGAGLFLKPKADEALVEGHPCGDPVVLDGDEANETDVVQLPEESEFAKLNNQFVVPVVEEAKVVSLVVMSLNLEVAIGTRTAVFALEPKLRDQFLQVMFDHANIGGFSGNFTSGPNMRSLRNELLRVARAIAGESVIDVLIIDIVRQDA